MDDSPSEITEVGTHNPGFPTEDTYEDNNEDLCRFCQSPEEEANNPLNYPCLCRGSIKFVHQNCLQFWIKHRGHKKCEVCGYTYSIVPVYSKNAPERLSSKEFLMGVLPRVSRYTKLIAPWIVVMVMNTYVFSLLSLGQEVADAFHGGTWMPRKFASLLAGLFYTAMIVCFMNVTVLIRMRVEYLRGRGFIVADFIGNGLGQGALGGLLHFLWKFMIILSDWYAFKVISFNQPELVLPNAPLDEFGVIRRLLYFLDDDNFAVLAISLYVAILFVLLPLSIRSILLATVETSYGWGSSSVILGFMMMLAIPFAFSGSLCTLFLRWFHFITVELPCLLWGLLVKSCKNLSLIKDAFVVCLKIVVRPWLIGYWLKICTSPMFGTTTSQRFEIDFPYQLILPWLAGFCCVKHANTYMDLIQEIIHKRAFSCLQDVAEPDYRVTKLNLGYTLFVFTSHGVLLVIMFHLPIRAVTLISPSFFPLELWVTDENLAWIALPIYLHLMMVGIDLLIKLTKPTIKLIVHNWIITVSSWLQLGDFLLVVPREEGTDLNMRPLLPPRQLYDGNMWVPLYILAEGSMVSPYGSRNAKDGTKDQRDDRFMVKIALMLVLAAFTLFLFSTSVIALPIFWWRVFFDAISFIMPRFAHKRDDVMGSWIGFNILRAIHIITCFVYGHIQKGGFSLLLNSVLVRLRNGLMFFTWIFVIPGLLGLLIEHMIIIPCRVSRNETPTFYLIKDWFTSLVVLHIWTFMTMFSPINLFATDAWRGKMERIRNLGVNGVTSPWLLRHVIGSIVSTFLTTLSIPYLLVKYVFPLLGFSQSINSTIERSIWPVLLALITGWFVAKLTRDLFVYLHQLVFNERYLVGERVDNLTEE